MNKETLRLIITYVELDQRIAHLTEEQAEGLKREAELGKELAQIERDEKTAQTVVHDIKKKIDALELESKVVQETQAKTRDKLLSASTGKELTALHLEEQDLAKKRAVLDEQGLGLLGDLEQAQHHVEMLAAQNPEIIQAKEKERSELELRQVHITQILKNAVLEKDRLTLEVPEEFLQQYVSMKERVPNPAVPIINDSCTGCFYGISRPELIKAQQGSLITCKGCYRFLYLTSALDDEQKEQ
jgi:predicted  nucleic acid-binding Zn-ribbon protein